jgi:carbonic anhydrase
MAHTADACIVVCIDFRFQKYIREFTDSKMKGETFDLVALGGSTKNLETIMGQIEISVRLHQIKKVVLVHHEECGAYGAESTAERHTHDLNLAKKAILALYAELSVEMYYLKLNGEWVTVA